MTVDRVWCVADAGLVVNPDGARNQLEGGIIQARELDAEGAGAVRRPGHRLASTGTAIRSCASARCRRSQAELVDGAGNPSLGVGECSVGPTAAAIGNAVAHALGVRIHDMPLTRERIMAALA